MTQLVLAMHNYESNHGRLPPAAVCSSYGEPLLSWRVLILPFIEQQELYDQFHLDEPWDSSHNIELLAKMPRTYEPPRGKRHKVPANHTVCQVFFGRGAAFEGCEGLTWKDFDDGASNTILIIEAGKPVPWTKPEDLDYNPDGTLPALDSLFKDIIRCGMGDGSRRFVPTDLNEASWRAAITRSGGEEMGPGW